MIQRALAADGQHVIEAKNLLAKIEANILFPLMSLMLTLALLLFLWGAFQYVANADSDEGRDTGRRHMLYGIIGMLVMTSGLAILRIVANTFGITVDTGS
jgi:hypothetical protein